MSDPIVDVAGKTVTHAGHQFILRPLTEDSFTVLIAGVPVGRAVYSFGANAVLEPNPHGVTEEQLQAVTFENEAFQSIRRRWKKKSTGPCPNRRSDDLYG